MNTLFFARNISFSFHTQFNIQLWKVRLYNFHFHSLQRYIFNKNLTAKRKLTFFRILIH